MNNEQQKAKELTKLLTAFADGKQLQLYYPGESLWRDSNITISVLLFRFDEGTHIRIKPETKRIALTMQDLIDRELSGKTMRINLGILNTVLLITAFDGNDVRCSGDIYSYDNLSNYTFLDGTPCYKEVECE